MNNITDKEFNFYGIEIKLIKIDDSCAAPVFNVIAKPNDSSKSARSASSQKSIDDKTDTEKFRYEFWLSFIEYMNDNPSKLFRPQRASDNHWMNIAIGTSKAGICLLINQRDNKITTQLYINCKFRSQGTAHFGVMVPLISVVGFFISLRWYRSVPKRSLSFFINGDFACMVPSDLSFTNGSFRSSGTAFGS